MTHGMATLAFEQTPIQLITYRGQRWVRGTEIARALGYKRPSHAVWKVFSRNIDEFTDEMTVLLPGTVEFDESKDAPHPQTEGGAGPERAGPVSKLDTRVNPYQDDTRLFSARGAHLFAMLARTERAAQFRRWVLDVLEGACTVEDDEPLTAMQEFRLIRYSVYLMDRMASAPNMERCEELFLRLMRVNRRLGMPTAAFSALMNPALRQQNLPLEGGGPSSH